MSMQAAPIIRGLFACALSGVLFAVFGSIKLLFLAGPSPFDDPVIASLFCSGIFLGSIFAFDKDSKTCEADSPLIRTAISAVSGIAFGMVWNWPVAEVGVIGVFAAAIGAVGMSWAK